MLAARRRTTIVGSERIADGALIMEALVRKRLERVVECRAAIGSRRFLNEHRALASAPALLGSAFFAAAFCDLLAR
jgi:hypothetical protein